MVFGWRFIYAASTAAAAFGFPCCGCCGNVERSPNQSPEKCTNPWATGLPCGSSIFGWCILMLEVVLNGTYCWKQWKWTMFWLEIFPHRVSTCSNRVLVGTLPIETFITPLKPGDWRIYCLIWNDGLDAIQATQFRRNNDSMSHFSKTEDRLHWTRVDLSALCSLDLLHFRAYETWKNWWRKMLDDSLMLKVHMSF